MEFRNWLEAEFGVAQKDHRAGTHRVVAPRQTVARVGRMTADLGITRVADITGLDRIGIPVVAVCRPNSRSVAVAQGKGINLPAAQASGLMEALETYHAEGIELPKVFASAHELRSRHTILDVERLPAAEGKVFDDQLKIWWIEGYDLINARSIWIPYEIVHTDYTFRLPEGSGCFLTSSNGLASGNHIGEAIIHAICEIVERDSVALWYYSSERDQRSTLLDLATVDDPACRRLLERFHAADMMLAVWDATSDVGIPAFLCWVAEKRNGRLPILDRQAIGAGCHASKQIALSRALTEAAQERLTIISGARDDLSPDDYLSGGDAVREAQAWIFERPALRCFSKIPSFEFSRLGDEVDWQLSRLQAAGVNQVAMVNLTSARFDVPVVRIVAPGLEAPFDLPGYAPGPRATAIMRRGH
jgi:ribosomal protein S12 methylthiotransferase accessory factor